MKNKIDILFIMSIIIYFLSLFFDGYYETHNVSGVPGCLLVIFGFFQIFSVGASLTWLANPIIWMSWRYRKRINLSFILSIVASLTSLSFLFFDIIKDGGSCGGTDGMYMSCDTKILKIGIGYYLWVLSIGIFTLRNYLKADIMKMKCEITKIINPIIIYIINYLDKFFKEAFPPNDKKY